MGLSGFLYVAIVVGWAVYLVPLALKRYDEATRNRSIDRFSSAMRVLGGRDDAVGTRETITTVKPPAVRKPSPDRQVQWAAVRTAARVAARRRRRVLVTLLAATAATGVVVALSLVSWWWAAVPAGVVAAWLVACRTQVRRESDAFWTDAAADHDGRRTRLGSRRSRLDPVPAGVANAARPSTDAGDDEPTVEIDQAAMAQVAVAVQTNDGGTLWDPVPVTLPTYVSKPRAPRTTRTIELGEPGTRMSGQTDETAGFQEVEQVIASAESGPSDSDGQTGDAPRRAVGE